MRGRAFEPAAQTPPRRWLTGLSPILCCRRLPQCSREASAKGEDDRSAEEKATFGRGLKGINEFYGHQLTYVLLVDTQLPEGPKTNTQPCLKRGWCLMEYYASGIVKMYDNLISLSKLEQAVRNGVPPLRRGHVPAVQQGVCGHPVGVAAHVQGLAVQAAPGQGPRQPHQQQPAAPPGLSLVNQTIPT